jgi:hypothetical protein
LKTFFTAPQKKAPGKLPGGLDLGIISEEITLLRATHTIAAIKAFVARA